MRNFWIIGVMVMILAGWLQYGQNLDLKTIEPVVPKLTPIEKVLGTTTEAKVIKVIDGDTIEIDTKQKLRLIGMNTPEMDNFGKTRQCFALEAKNKLTEMIGGKTVELQQDVSETDKYGRLLRYVWLNGEMINEKLVALGYARVATYPPDVKYKDKFIAAEREAREKNLGLWAKCEVK